VRRDPGGTSFRRLLGTANRLLLLTVLRVLIQCYGCAASAQAKAAYNKQMGTFNRGFLASWMPAATPSKSRCPLIS